MHLTIELDPSVDAAAEAELRRREVLRAGELRAAGKLVRIWRDPGRRANWSLYEAADATELHDLLASLPLWPWMSARVHALAHHPVEDGPAHAG